MKKSIAILILVGLSFPGLIYLANREQEFATKRNQKFMELVEHSDDLSGALESDLLKSRIFLLQHFDSIAETTSQLTRYCLDMRALVDPSELRLIYAVDKYCAGVVERLSFVEQFKSKSSVFRNSLYFLQAAAVEGESTTRTRLEMKHHRLVVVALAYAINPTEDARTAFQNQVQAESGNLKNGVLLAHAEKILLLKSTIDGLLEQILRSTYAENLQNIRTTYFDIYVHEKYSAQSYKSALVVLVIIFLNLFAYTMLRIWRSAGELAAANRELGRKVKDVERANLAKSVFLANISHELRTPMHGILSFAKIGQEHSGSSPADTLRSYFDEIHDSGSRLMYLLNDLLDLSKLEAEKMVYSIEENDLVQVLDSVRSEQELVAKSANLFLTVAPCTTSPLARFDQLRITQVVRNIVSNAIKFSAAGSTVVMSVESAADQLRVSVSNQGVGIPSDELSMVFDKFAQSSRTRSASGGTGLGLAICKEIIAQHGGRIWAECTDNRETRFIFEIPIHVPVAADAEPEAIAS